VINFLGIKLYPFSLFILNNALNQKNKVGDDGKRIALEVKKGDRILFGKYSGTEVKIEGDEYLIMREDDVLGIID